MSKSTKPEATSYHHTRFAPLSGDDKLAFLLWLKTRNKYASGFCNEYQPLDAQSHEGDNVNRHVCDMWDTCPCRCHYQIDQMYEMVGLPREPAEQSAEYRERLADLRLSTQMMLDSLVRYAAVVDVPSTPDGTDAPPDPERAAAGQGGTATGTPAPVVTPTFAPTPTGRRARGQLEYDVLVVCTDYVGKVFEWEDCTPKLVSEEIGRRYAIEPPSTGAINAVWDRWEKIGFAEQAKKPSRLVRFLVENPSVQVLDAIKHRNKRSAKRASAEQARGIPRPVRRK